jgi:hypothetical protein
MTTPTSQIQINTLLEDDHWTITATVVEGGYLPPDIFIFQNTGTSELGVYWGVCALSEYVRLQTWTGTPIAQFGNRFVKYTQAKIIIGTSNHTQEDVTNAINHLTTTAHQLSIAMQSSGSSSQVVTV